MANQLAAIKHVVQLMLENRSFDQMLGFLYASNGNKKENDNPEHIHLFTCDFFWKVLLVTGSAP